ncbi:MAG: hypothetical protein Q8O33_04460 [Pseudomonadota bacterium]|nr:hypothetical protein [Pseudomonadota bacterium]
MSEKLFYYLWHTFFGAIIIGVALNFMGLLPAWLVAWLAYALTGVAGGVVLTWLLRLFIFR